MIKTYLRIFELLSPRERRGFVLMVGLIIAMGLVDVLGVASILPFLAVIANPEVIDTNPILATLKQSTGITERDSFLLLLGIGVFLAVTVGLAVRAFTFYALTRFIRMRMLSLSMRLFRRYLAKPYVWYLNRHSADLTKALMAETADVINGPLDGAMRLLAQGAIVFFIIAFLVLIDPTAAVGAALVVGVCYGLAYTFFQKQLVEFGHRRVAANRARFQVVQEAFGGIKDVKIRGLEEDYLHRFYAPSRELASHQTRVLMMSEMPRFAFEGIAVGGMVLFVLWLLVARQGALESVLPLLGAYAFAGIRMFPAVQEIFRALTKIRHGEPSLELIHKELLAEGAEPGMAAPEGPAMALDCRLRLAGIEFTYPGTERQVLRGIDLEIPAHGVIGIAGTSGAGKSTVIDIIMGLLVPTGGRMTVDGVEIDDGNRRLWRSSIGYVPQETFLLDASLAANIAFGVPADRIDMQAVLKAGRLAGVDSFAEGLPKGYDTMVGERGTRLSGGQRQRVAIARALYADPQVLVFDEATSSLDTVSERDVMDAVASLGRAKTIIKIAHRLSTLRDCDTIYLLEHGEVVGAGSYDELVNSSATFQALHGAI